MENPKEQNPTEQLKKALTSLNAKENKFYFLVQDTKGVQRASVATTYEFVKILTEDGYNAFVLHEKNDYHGVGEWLGEEYSSLPHASIESQELSVGPADFLIIPEVFGHVLDQTKEMPCSRIVFCQSYDYVFEMLPPGFTWGMMNVSNVMTTGEATTAYLKSIFPNLEAEEIKLGIPEFFKPSEKPKMPVVTIHTREPRETMKIVKSFYVKFPQFKWITFRDLRNLPTKKFAEDLSESFVSVWVDDISGFGTFPLESMKCEVPVIGKVPNLKPEWMTEDNGIWSYNFNQIVDILGNFVQKWLEDELPQELYTEMEKTVKKYNKDEFSNSVMSVFNAINERKVNEIRRNLEKLTPVGPQDNIEEGSVTELFDKN